MKPLKYIAFTIAIAGTAVTGCKSDRADDTQVDTTSAVSATPNPYSAEPTPSTDSLVAPVDSSAGAAAATTAPATTAPSTRPANSKAEPVTTRARKTSRKGRIILAALNNSSAVNMVPDRDGVYSSAEIMPAYPGGEKQLRRFIEDNIRYPKAALDDEVEGTVKVSFAVDEQGKIYRPMVISSPVGHGLEEEALRVIRQMPRWTPGQIKGKNVKTRFTLPITYQLQ